MKKIATFILAISASLFLCKSAFANAPIGAAAFLVYPTISYIKSSAVALIVAIAIESLVFSRITKLNIAQSIIITFVANIASSILGMAILAAFSSSFLFMILLLPLAWGLSKIFKFSSNKTSMYASIAKYSFVIFIGVELACCLLGSILLPLTNATMRKYFAPPSMAVAAISTVSLVLIGFLLTLVAEMYAVLKYHMYKNISVDKTTVKAVILMNLASYITLSLLYGPTIMRNAFKQ